MPGLFQRNITDNVSMSSDDNNSMPSLRQRYRHEDASISSEDISITVKKYEPFSDDAHDSYSVDS